MATRLQTNVGEKGGKDMQITALGIITVIYLPPPIGSRVDYRSKAQVSEAELWQAFSLHYSLVCLNSELKIIWKALGVSQSITVHVYKHVNAVLLIL